MKYQCILVILLLSLVCTGCSNVPRTIPAGQWSGTGTYADYEIPDPVKSPTSQPRSHENTYATTLEITENTMFGYSVRHFDICSKRGQLMNVSGEETHLTFLLVKVQTLANGVELFAVVNPRFNPTEIEDEMTEAEFKEKLHLPTASCIRQGGSLVLQIAYGVPAKDDPSCFWDTFSFEGNRVRKSGRFIRIESEKPGEPPYEKFVSVDWVEELRKIK